MTGSAHGRAAAIRILHLEDDAADSELIRELLWQGGIGAALDRVDELGAFAAALDGGEHSLILSDFTVPGLDALEAMALARRIRPEVPYIFVSGTLGEEVAIETLRRGATDYVLKHRLDRLVPSVRRALEEVEDRRLRRAAEAAAHEKAEALRAMFENVALGIVEVDPDSRILNVNQRLCELLGYRREELLGMTIHDLTAPEDRPRSDDLNDRLHRGELDIFDYEKRYLRKGGAPVWVHVTVSAVRDAGGRVRRAVGTVEDITRRKRAEAQVRELTLSLQRRNAELDAERMKWRGVVEGIADEVWVCDADGRISLVNVPDAAAMGLSEFEGRTIAEVLEELEFAYPDGSPRPPAEAPLLRSLRHGEIVRAEEILRIRRTGVARRRQLSSAPMRDADGRITGAVAIVRDVTQARQAEEALREADRRKSEFLAVLSHELRNPLAPIRNSIYLLDRAPPGGEQARRAARVIDRQVTHMTRLIDDLLDVTRISRGKIRLQRERVELCALVHGTAEDHRSVFVRGDVALEVQACEAPLWIEGDPTRIAQVVGNLLSNAAKFTPRGGHVVLALEADQEAAIIRVSDDGAGIPPELLRSLFEPFIQVDQTLDRSNGGLGLGLALVKGLVELHGGSVSVHSDGPGRGAVFTVRLPRAIAASPQHGIGPARDAASTAIRVLVIEDAPDTAESLKDVLELSGHEVALAGSGPEGVDRTRSLRPDVVLCDLGLPGFDGYEVARRLRADPALRAIPLVALSGYALPEDVDRAREAGFARHLAKPPDLGALERTLAEVVAGERAAAGQKS